MMVHVSIIKSEHIINSNMQHQIEFTHKSGESSSYGEFRHKELSPTAKSSLSDAIDVQFFANYYGSRKYPEQYNSHLPTKDIISNKRSDGIHSQRLGMAMAYHLKFFPDFITNVDMIVPVPNFSSDWDSKFKANSIANNLSLYIKQFHNKVIPVKQFLKKTVKTNMKFMWRNERLDFFIKNPDTYCSTSDSNFYGKTVLLVDDVITCGTTMGSCLKKIISSGGNAYCFAATHTKL